MRALLLTYNTTVSATEANYVYVYPKDTLSFALHGPILKQIRARLLEWCTVLEIHLKETKNSGKYFICVDINKPRFSRELYLLMYT